MSISLILYVVAGALVLYIIVSVIRTKSFTTGDALAALGIVIAVILAVTAGVPQSTGDTPARSSLAAVATSEPGDRPTPTTATATPEAKATETTPVPIPTQTEALSPASPTAQSPQEAATPRVTVAPANGIGGEFLEVSRFGQTLTVRLLLTNTGTEDQQTIMILGFSYLQDERTGEKYRHLKDSAKPFEVVPAGGSSEVWGQYEVPPEANPSHLTLVLQNNTLFQHIPIPTASP